MDYTKFPRQRGAVRSFEGERQARFLDTLGAPALHRRNFDGSTSSKNGGRLDVVAEQGLGAFITAGRLASGADATVFSPNAAGAFGRRGALPFGTGLEPMAEFVSNGDSTASELEWEAAGFVDDFDFASTDKPLTRLALVAGLKTFRTPDGAAAVEDLDAYSSAAVLETSWGFTTGSITAAPLAGQVLAGGPAGSLRGVATIGMIDRQYWPMFFRRVGQGAIEAGNTLGAMNTHLMRNELLVLGPGRLLMVATCARATYDDTLADNATNPVLIAQYSTDGGATWSEVTGLAALAAEVGSIQAVPADQQTTFNALAYLLAFSDPAPISATKALALLTIPHYDAAHPIDKRRARVKVVEIDTAGGCSITTRETIFEGRASEAAVFRGLSIPTGTGMLYTTNDVVPNTENALDDNWREAPTKPAKIWGTDGGASTLVGTMPQAVFRTGRLFFATPGLLLCPMYADGAHRLYQSTDRGATWRPRALIASTGRVPSYTPAGLSAALGALLLGDFSTVARLRETNGRPANLYPQAPWIMDSRINAPA